MSYFNSNITGGSGGGSGLITKFMKTIAISSSALAKVTIDISSDIANYKDITNDNIIIELNNASAIAAGDAELSHTYDAETGVITITSTNSNIPFASSSAVKLDVNVYIAGAVQMPTPPINPPIESITVKQKAGSNSSNESTFNFVVNVGQMAILSTGNGTWQVSDNNAVLDSIAGDADSVSDKSNQGKYCDTKIVLPNEKTGAVSCSGTFGGITWKGGAYIILDIK